MWVQASPRASPVNPAVSLGLETAHVTLRVSACSRMDTLTGTQSQSQAQVCTRTHVDTHTHSLPLQLQISLPQGGALPSSAVTPEALPET